MKAGTTSLILGLASLGIVCRADAAITGSYVTLDVCLDAAGWLQEFAAMKRAGHDTVMLAGVYNGDEHLSYYASSRIPDTRLHCGYDELEAVLSAADAHGFNAYVGPLEINCDWWDDASACFADATALHRDVAQEVYDGYKSRHASFKGWYIRQEVGLNDIVEFGSDIGTVKFHEQVAADLDAIGASPLPILTPPYFVTRPGPEGGAVAAPTSAEVQAALASYLQAVPRVDVIALQDGVGAGHVELDEVASYFAAARQAADGAGKVMWGGIENFEYAGPDAEFTWRPTRTPIFFADMNAVAPHVGKQVTWIFNPFQSPQSVRFPVEAPRFNAEVAAEGLPSDWAAGRRYTLSTAPSATYPDSASELTDGTLGTGDSWGPWLGWTGLTSALTVVVDLGQLREIQSVRALSQTSGAAGIAFPSAFTAEVSNDRVSWRRFGWGSGFAAQTSDSSTDWSAISGYDTARHVRLRFVPAQGQWLFLSEVDVKGGAGRSGYPLATGKTYTLSPAPASPYVDDGRRLTDGMAGMSFHQDPALNTADGWLTGSQQVTVTATVDLGASYSIASAGVNTGAGEFGLEGGADYRATSVRVWTSSTGSTFTRRGSTSQTGSFMSASFSPVSARYVRFEVTKTHGGFGKDWLFIGDLEVLGQ